MSTRQPHQVLLGVIAGPHGVRGALRVRSFTDDPAELAAHGPLHDEAGRRYALSVIGRGSGTGVVLARLEGVADRDAAEALKGTRLYVDRAALPEIEEAGEFYAADLIGLVAQDRDGRSLGRVVSIDNYGASDVIEIERPGAESLLLAFTTRTVPVVDLAQGRIVVEVPGEVEAQPETEPATEGATELEGAPAGRQA
jgi:16S rRNA processing protein RimM